MENKSNVERGANAVPSREQLIDSLVQSHHELKAMLERIQACKETINTIKENYDGHIQFGFCAADDGVKLFLKEVEFQIGYLTTLNSEQL